MSDKKIRTMVTAAVLAALSCVATMVVQEINVSFDWGAASAISYILLAVILLIQLLVVLSTGGYMKRLGGGKNA